MRIVRSVVAILCDENAVADYEIPNAAVGRHLLDEVQAVILYREDGNREGAA